MCEAPAGSCSAERAAAAAGVEGGPGAAAALAAESVVAEGVAAGLSAIAGGSGGAAVRPSAASGARVTAGAGARAVGAAAASGAAEGWARRRRSSCTAPSAITTASASSPAASWSRLTVRARWRICATFLEANAFEGSSVKTREKARSALPVRRSRTAASPCARLRSTRRARSLSASASGGFPLTNCLSSRDGSSMPDSARSASSCCRAAVAVWIRAAGSRSSSRRISSARPSLTAGRTERGSAGFPSRMSRKSAAGVLAWKGSCPHASQ